MRTRTRALAGGLAAAAVLGAGAAHAAVAAQPAAAAQPSAASVEAVGPPANRTERTEVSFDRSVVRQLVRLGVRVRAVDAEQSGRGEDVRISFRVDRARGDVIEHRGGLLLDSPRRPDVFLGRPTVDLRRDTVSFAVGRDRVTVLSIDDRGRGNDRPGGGRGDDRPGDGRGDDRGGDRPGGQQGNQPGGQQGNQPGGQQGNQPGGQQGSQQGNRPGGQQGQQGTRPAPGGGGAVPVTGDRDRDRGEVTLRLTRDGERLLDRALGTDVFWTGQVVGTAEFDER